MTADTLNRLCALHVDGWKLGEQAQDKSAVYWKDGQWVYPCDLPQYCTDPAAVIGLLDLNAAWHSHCGLLGQHRVTVHTGIKEYEATAPTFAEAGVRALLKAHGCEGGE